MSGLHPGPCDGPAGGAPAVGDARIYHICSRGAAGAARCAGTYRAPSLDQEGFIHLSRSHQVRGVLAAYYAGQPDLVLLVVDPARLVAPLRYEAPGPMPVAAAPAPAPSELFPHLYGPLNGDAVVEVLDVAAFLARG